MATKASLRGWVPHKFIGLSQKENWKKRYKFLSWVLVDVTLKKSTFISAWWPRMFEKCWYKLMYHGISKRHYDVDDRRLGITERMAKMYSQTTYIIHINAPTSKTWMCLWLANSRFFMHSLSPLSRCREHLNLDYLLWSLVWWYHLSIKFHTLNFSPFPIPSTYLVKMHTMKALPVDSLANTVLHGTHLVTIFL